MGSHGRGTFTQSGGTLTARQWLSIGRYYQFGNGYYSISGGTLLQTSATRRIIVGEQGTGTLTVSGTALVDSAGGVRFGASGAITGNGTIRLNGGTIYTPLVEDLGGTSTFHFNGGTLKARSATDTFMQDLDTADVQQGGAVIDTNGFNVTIAQPLSAGSASGGLNKIGSGTLTLTSAPTYTGNTEISAGRLQLATGNATMAAISGPGELLVGSARTPTQLTAPNISVGTLTVAAGSTVTISPIAGGPLAALSSPTAVPEPGVWLLLLSATAAYITKRRLLG